MENKKQAKTASDYVQYYEENKVSILFRGHYSEGEQERTFAPIRNATESDPILVGNYPYGRLRTNIRYWVETTKRGDRFCSQTLNPKTNQWNKPKKSTYCDVIHLIIDNNGHVAYASCSYNDDESLAKEFFRVFKDLSDIQKERLHAIIGWSKSLENVEFKCDYAAILSIAQPNRSKEEQEVQ